MTLNPYLNFSGNCKAAFDYYVQHLGAKMLMCMTYADMPQNEQAQPGCTPVPSDKIMHARLQMGDGILMGSDGPPERVEPQAGVFINLGTKNPKEAERLYAALSPKAQIFMPLEETFWAHKFGMLKDQFGVSWMINCEKEPS